MENIQQDNTLKFFIGVGIIFSAIQGFVTLIKYLEEKEIARKKMEISKK